MNMATKQTHSSHQPSHPHKPLMKGIPSVVAMYLLSLDEPGIPYVDIYAEDYRRLNIQPHQLIGKPYNWHGTCPGIRVPRVKAIDELLEKGLDAGSYEYQYWDRKALWKFQGRLLRLPFNYLLLTISDSEDWQKGYWNSSIQPLESFHDDHDEDDCDECSEEEDDLSFL